jgi:hypothetical protein
VIRLTTSTLVKLRDRLRESGARPSLPMSVAPASPDELLAALLTASFGPLCEAMYIVMAADGIIAGAERDVVRGALRELDARIRSVHVDAMLAEAARALTEEGRARRLEELGFALADDPARADAAFQLAAAVAAADDVLAPEEKVVLKELGTALGIPAPRARQLLAALEHVDEVVGQGAGIDATDVLLHAAMRVAAPEDFERLAATSTRVDVTLMLRLYAAFTRSGEDLRDKGNAAGEPRSITAARVAALEDLVRSIPAEASPHAQALRVTLARLAVGIAEADHAVALRPLAEGAALATLEDALASLAQVATNARRRCGETVPDLPAAPGELAGAVSRVVATDDATARSALDAAIDASARRTERSVPAEIANVVTMVARRLGALPVDPPGAAPPPSRDPAAPALPPWLPAKRVLGGFYVLSPLGGGGAGSVFVVVRSDERDEPGAERFALKVPHYDAAAARSISEAEFLKMFREEAGALLALPEHDNLARFITFDARARPKPVLVMELVEGTPCDVMLADRVRRLDVPRAVGVLDGVLAGLQAMHGAGIGHLDLKPSNVIVRSSGQPALVDFGLSGRHLRPGCATAAYGAPEVWGLVSSGPPPTPMQADVYGFACVAFEVMTGKTLFDAPSEMACVAAHVSHDGLPEAVSRLAKDPRYAPLGNLLYHCLRRDAHARPAVSAVRSELARIAPEITSVGWPVGADVLAAISRSH